MEIIETTRPLTTLNASFSNGWNVMKKYFLILLLVVMIIGLITAPAQAFKWHFHPFRHATDWDFHFPHIELIALGLIAVIFGLFTLAYALLVVPVFKYGGRMIFVQAVRDTRPDFNLIVSGFRENYLGIILASLLTFSLIMLGFIALFIPGIIIGCRLAFVSYLVMDKKLDPIAAVEESWKLTRGHGWTIFGMALVSILIFIAGFCLFVVGILPAAMWVGSSFASLYEAVLIEKNAKTAAV